MARRYRVSVGMVKKLLQQRRRTGEIASRHRFSGRKPLILPAHRKQMRKLLKEKPDLTLEELRAGLDLNCTLPAIHYVLVKIGLTYKKRRSVRANKIVRTSRKPAGSGAESKAGLTLSGSSSLTSRRQRRT